MFRNDKATIKRPNLTRISGEDIYGQPSTIAVDIPCHLSVKSISATNQSQSTATVLYDFTLFYNTGLVTIYPNDIIDVTTAQGQEYNLRAGESHKYLMTTQTHCEMNEYV